MIHFNPHSRVGSDSCALVQDTRPEDISIHTPAWGVTRYQASAAGKKKISIHTPAWGVTKRGLNVGPHEIFQSTLPRGE